MQTVCPQCSQGIIVDDAKVPERPFAVRCPRCRTTIHIPGRESSMPDDARQDDGADAWQRSTPAEVAARTTSADSLPISSPASTAPDDARVQTAIWVRDPGDQATEGRALVAIADGAQAGALTLALTRQGFVVDAPGDDDEAMRRLERGTCALVAATMRSGKSENLYQRVKSLSPEARRRVFVLLVGEEFRSGDPLRAFTVAADLVLHPRDLAMCDPVLSAALAERRRLYQAFLDARRRLDGAVS